VSCSYNGTFQVGTSLGFVAVAPTLAHTEASVYFTDLDYADNKIGIVGTGLQTGLTSTVYDNMPYAGSQFLDGDSYRGSTLVGRMVSFAIRARYTGTELNRGGTMYLYVHPDHQSVNNLSLTTAASFKECIRVPVTRQWQEIVISAVDHSETTFPDASPISTIGGSGSGATEYTLMFPFSQGQELDSTSSTKAAPVICIFATGTKGNTFEFECIAHAEYVGKPAQAASSKSHADAEGLSNVTSIAGGIPAERQASGLSQAAAFVNGAYALARENREAIAVGARVIQHVFGNPDRRLLR
jgi:hypothetical protein